MNADASVQCTWGHWIIWWELCDSYAMAFAVTIFQPCGRATCQTVLSTINTTPNEEISVWKLVLLRLVEYMLRQIEALLEVCGSSIISIIIVFLYCLLNLYNFIKVNCLYFSGKYLRVSACFFTVLHKGLLLWVLWLLTFSLSFFVYVSSFLACAWNTFLEIVL